MKKAKSHIVENEGVHNFGGFNIKKFEDFKKEQVILYFS